MGVWEFFRKKNDDNQENKNSINESKNGQNKNYFKGKNPELSVFIETNSQRAFLSKSYLNYQDPIPSLQELDSREDPQRIDVGKLLFSSSPPDHKIASIILSNIFLIPRNMKGYEDSWPVYQENLNRGKEVRLQILERKAKEEIKSLKGKGKNIKQKYYDVLREKREECSRYYREYEKLLTLHIQKIRVEIIPIEKEISSSKYRLNDLQQAYNLVRGEELMKLKEYNSLLDSNIKSLGKIKDALKNILSLKKIWQAAHIVASYILALVGATEFVKTDQFKELSKKISGKLSFFGTAIKDFVSNNFELVQALTAALVFLVTVGAYDKLVIDYLKRREIKKEIKKIVEKEEKLKQEIDEIKQKIDALKEERSSKIKSMISDAEQEIEYLYEKHIEKMNELDEQLKQR
jgi:cell division septum initiation protein DivIVA